MATRTETVQAFARDHPYVAFGGLLVPVTFGVTGDPMMSLFAGGMVAIGPQLAEGFQDLNDDVDVDAEEDADE